MQYNSIHNLRVGLTKRQFKRSCVETMHLFLVNVFDYTTLKMTLYTGKQLKLLGSVILFKMKIDKIVYTLLKL